MAFNKTVLTQLTSALDKISDALIVVAPDDNIAYVNDTFLNLFPGRGKADFINQSIGTLLEHVTTGLEERNNFSEDAMHRYLHGQLKSSEPINVEFENDSGRFLRYQDSLSPEGFRIGIFSDESAIVALHKQFENACEEAEKLSHAKNSFMAAMSHEVKTPLNAIIGMLDLCALDDYIGNNEYIQRIQRNADNLLGLINNVLDFAKFDANKVALSPVDTNIRLLCEDIMESFAGNAEQNSTELLLMVDPRIPKSIELDDIRISQVINNLISNGLKFNRSQHPKLSLSVRYDIDTNMIQCAVKDNGIGISENEQKYIFAGFEQASTETHRQFGGTGLGLSICQRISWLMNGSLELESEEGKGATFIFSFPLPDGTKPLTIDEIEEASSFESKELLTNSPIFFKALNLYKPFFSFKTKFCKHFPSSLESSQIAFISNVGEDEKHLISNIEYEDQVYLLRHNQQTFDEDLRWCTRSPLKLAQLSDAVCSKQGNNNPEHQSHPSINFDTKLAVLIVEDNKDNMFVLQRQCEKLGLNADFALQPDLAIEYFAHKTYVIVLSDYQMPGKNGAELIRHLRTVEENEKRTYCPMFVVTADKTQQCLDRCKEAGADEVIMKPLTLSSISALIAENCQHSLSGQELTSSGTIDDLPTSEHKKYDLAVLADILGDVSQDDLNEFFFQYIDNFTSARRELEKVAAQEDWPQLGSLAHAMKSSALIIDAKDLSQACQALEKHCQINIDPELAKPLWDSVYMELSVLAEQLDEFTNKDGQQRSE